MNTTFSANDITSGSGPLPNDPAFNSASLSTDVLFKAMEEAKDIEARLQKQIEELQRCFVNAQEEVRILTKLIELRSGRYPAEPVDEVLPISSLPPLHTVGAKSGHDALKAVLAILKEANRPVHISDLMRLLSEKNVRIPGSGTQANLISHLRRDKRIVRPSRGMYGLALWGLTEMPSGSKRRRRRRRAR